MEEPTLLFIDRFGAAHYDNGYIQLPPPPKILSTPKLIDLTYFGTPKDDVSIFTTLMIGTSGAGKSGCLSALSEFQAKHYGAFVVEKQKFKNSKVKVFDGDYHIKKPFLFDDINNTQQVREDIIKELENCTEHVYICQLSELMDIFNDSNNWRDVNDLIDSLKYARHADPEHVNKIYINAAAQSLPMIKKEARRLFKLLILKDAPIFVRHDIYEIFPFSKKQRQWLKMFNFRVSTQHIKPLSIWLFDDPREYYFKEPQYIWDKNAKPEKRIFSKKRKTEDNKFELNYNEKQLKVLHDFSYGEGLKFLQTELELSSKEQRDNFLRGYIRETLPYFKAKNSFENNNNEN